MSLKSLGQGKLLGFLKWLTKNLRQLTKLRAAFARVLACVRKSFLVKSRNCVSVRVKKTRISDENKLIKRAANCCSYILSKAFNTSLGKCNPIQVRNLSQ